MRKFWRAFLVAQALVFAGSQSALAEKAETVTAVTIYWTKPGVSSKATPAYNLHVREAEALPLDWAQRSAVQAIIKEAELGHAVFKPDDPYLAPPWPDTSLTLEEETAGEETGGLSDEAKFGLLKSGGAVFIAFAIPQAGLLAAVYAGSATALGTFGPLGKIVNDVDARAAQLMLQNANGEYVDTDYRAVAYSSWLGGKPGGVEDLLHYTYRHVRTRSAPQYLSLYFINEWLSWLIGQVLELARFEGTLGKAITSEATGSFIGALAEKNLSGSPGGGGSDTGCITQYMPNGMTRCYPRASVKPSIVVARAPSLRVLAPLPHYVTEISDRTFPGVPASHLITAAEADVVIVQMRPDAFAGSPTLPSSGPPPPAPPPPPDDFRPADSDTPIATDSHSVNLPSSVEIHGLGNYSINR